VNSNLLSPLKMMAMSLVFHSWNYLLEYLQTERFVLKT
jgi:hypothetical protein